MQYRTVKSYIEKVVNPELETVGSDPVKRHEVKMKHARILFESGRSINTVANSIGFSSHRLSRLLKEDGYEVKMERRISKELQQKIVDAYKSGEKISSIIQRLGTSYLTIYRTLEQHGVKLRDGAISVVRNKSGDSIPDIRSELRAEVNRLEYTALKHQERIDITKKYLNKMIQRGYKPSSLRHIIGISQDKVDHFLQTGELELIMKWSQLDNDLVYKLHRQGDTNQQIAELFGVKANNIAKRLQLIKAERNK